jgi:hypothetical protein
MNVYEAMLEGEDEALRLPVTVSPEYGGSSLDAWGPNSTFFLVNVHFLCEKLIQVSTKLQMSANDIRRYEDIRSRLPQYAAGTGKYGKELSLWEGRSLEESHRHHSHMAGIFPFDMINWSDDRERHIVRNTYRSWVEKGMGQWSGWSFPWASILHARMGNADMAYFSLKILLEAFTMKGCATRHNASYEGVSTFTGGDIMQLDAAIGSAAAVLELFVQNVRGVVRVFHGFPSRFANALFQRIRTEGAFLLSGEKRDNRIVSIQVYSEQGGNIRLDNPFHGPVRLTRSNESEWLEGMEILDILTVPGETVTLQSADL